MNTLWNGAKMLPLRHLSIRVPWNDTNWSGVICEKPGENISCRAFYYSNVPGIYSLFQTGLVPFYNDLQREILQKFFRFTD